MGYEQTVHGTGKLLEADAWFGIDEDFMQIDALTRWDTNDNVGTNAPTVTIDDTLLGGWLKATTGAAADDGVQIHPGALGEKFGFTTGATLEFKTRLKADALLTGTAFFGFSELNADIYDTLASSLTAVGFRLDGDGAVDCTAYNAGTVYTGQKTAVLTVANNTTYLFSMQISCVTSTSINVNFWIDGALVARLEGVTVEAYTTEMMNPVVCFGDLASKILHVDMIKARQTR